MHFPHEFGRIARRPRRRRVDRIERRTLHPDADPRYHRPQTGRGRVGQSPRRGAGVGPDQIGISGQYQPRSPDAFEWHHRHDGAAPGHAHDGRTTAMPENHPGQLGHAVEHHQRHTGLLEDRGWQTAVRNAGLRPEGHRGKYRGTPGRAGARQRHRTGVRDL